MLKPEVERMRGLLVEAITTLCRSGLQYNSNLKVEGLIGITLDEADIILVNLNRSFGSVMDNNIKRKRKQKRRKTRNTESSGSESESSESDRDDASKARRNDESFDLNNTNVTDVTPELGDTSSHLPDSLPGDNRVPALGEAAETNNTPQTGALSQGKGTSPSDSKTVVKIEIDSDAEVEEVKFEPGQKTDLWNVSMSTSSCPVSDGMTLQTDMSSRLVGIPGGLENTPEILQSHLPPELAAETQQDQNLQSSYFSSPQPVPGPSGFAMATPGGNTYSPDMQSSMVFPVQTNSQKIKITTLQVDGKTSFYCRQCQVLLPDNQSLKEHLRTNHPTKSSCKEPHICPFCAYCTVRKSNLERHIIAIHKHTNPAVWSYLLGAAQPKEQPTDHPGMGVNSQ